MGINIKFKPLQKQFEYDKLVEETKLHNGWKIPSSQEIKRLKPAKEHDEVWVSDTPDPNNNEDGTRAVIYNFKEKRTFEVHKLCLMNVLILEEEVRKEAPPGIQEFENLVKRMGYAEDEIGNLRNEVLMLKAYLEKDLPENIVLAELPKEEFEINQVPNQLEYDENGAPILTLDKKEEFPETQIDYIDVAQKFIGILGSAEHIENVVNLYRAGYTVKTIGEKLNIKYSTMHAHILKLKKAKVITSKDIKHRYEIERIMEKTEKDKNDKV